MKKLKVQLTGILLLAAAIAVPTQTMAQWSVGLSYQIRDEAPKYGFGIRVQRSILGKLPLIDLGLRAHFAYFNSENDVSGEGVTIGTKVAYYDYGIAGVAGVSLGFLKPYVSLGIGANTIDFESEQNNKFEGGSAFYWYGSIGVELTPLPTINPFIEYRFQPVEEPGDVAEQATVDEFWNSDGRFILGVSISF